MDKHNDESGCYDEIKYSEIVCSVCGEKKIPLGQEEMCEHNGKYYCPGCFHDMDAENERKEINRD